MSWALPAPLAAATYFSICVCLLLWVWILLLLVFLRVCHLFCFVLILPLQGMPPSSNDAPESCGLGSSMRGVTRPRCHPGTGLMSQLHMTPSSGRGTGPRDRSSLINASGRINHGQNCTPGKKKTLCSSVFAGLMPNSEPRHLSEQFVLKEGRRSCFPEGAGWLKLVEAGNGIYPGVILLPARSSHQERAGTVI